MARQGRRLLVAVLTLGLVVTGQLSPSTVAPALAEDPPLASPFLTDGDWTGTLNAAGPFDIEEFHGVVDYSGTFEFVVTSGAINAGIWSIDGAGSCSMCSPLRPTWRSIAWRRVLTIWRSRLPTTAICPWR